MGDLEAGGVGRNWVGSERKGQSFGKVKEATVPTWGEWGRKRRPILRIVTQRQSNAHSDTEMSPETQSHDTAPHSVATP